VVALLEDPDDAEVRHRRSGSGSNQGRVRVRLRVMARVRGQLAPTHHTTKRSSTVEH
jgi:hypothetical protein